MAVRGAIDPAGQPAVVKGGVFRRFGRQIVLAAAALAAALLMAPTASAQLYTSTNGTEYWTSARWASGTSGPFTSNWVSGSNTNFATSGTYTFGRLASSGTETLGDITTGTGVFIIFYESGTSQGGNLNFGGAGGQVKTLDFGAGSLVDLRSIVIAANNGNGITKNGAGTLVLTGGDYKGGFTLNAGNVIARGANALGNGNIVINGGAIGATANTTLLARATGKTITVAGDFQLGTSGTFMGVGRALRARAPHVRLIAVQPDGPYHALEGVKHMASVELVPSIYDPALADEVVEVASEAALAMVRRLARREGLMVGISAAANVVAALTVARRLTTGVVVTILCDSAAKYLSDRLWDEATVAAGGGI